MTPPDNGRQSHSGRTALRRPGGEIDPAGGPLLDPTTAAATWALFAGLGVLMVGNGLQGSLIGVRTQTEAFSPTVTGVIMTAYFVGYLGGSRSVVRALQAVGHIRVFAALASIASSAVLIQALAAVPALWTLMRFALGFCMAGLYVLVESWLNAASTGQNRGRLMAVYMAVSMGGLAVGQFLLNLGDPGGFELFVLAAVLISIALVPVTLSASSSPPETVFTKMSLREVIGRVPGGAATAFAVGLSHGALLGLGAAYAASIELSTPQIALFLALPMIGGVLFQFPIGLAADRLPRKGLIVAVALTAAGAAALLSVVEPATTTAHLLVFVLGGMIYPLYSLAIAYTIDRIALHEILGASSALITINGVGAVLGPLIASLLIQVIGATGLFWALVASNGLVAVIMSSRAVFGRRFPTSGQRPFVPFPARGARGATTLLVRRRGSR